MHGGESAKQRAAHLWLEARELTQLAHLLFSDEHARGAWWEVAVGQGGRRWERSNPRHERGELVQAWFLRDEEWDGR